MSELDLPANRNVDAFALIVHVWHLDTLDDLSAACDNFPAEADRFVTFADSLPPEDRKRIADRFAGAQLVAVRNVGQDVGALMQLMDQVDLGRYGFVCKIHSKKGPKMPEAWRRTLLGGVLGSRRQVDQIVAGFREDPQVMLAGARQLFLYGPAYLWKNADGIDDLAGPLLQGFDFRSEEWGFVAGTCFFIRTGILLRLKALQIDWQPGAYVDDGTPAHVLERMFGMLVAIDGGTVLLSDPRDNEAPPQPITGFPESLPRKRIPITETLSELEAARRRRKSRRTLPKRRRVAVFASYSGDGSLPPQVKPYLEGLRPFVDRIVVVCDNSIGPLRRTALEALADHVIAERHGEYDFGSYKRGVAWARQAGWLDEADDLILCNDSCFGPVGSFAPMFERMDARHLDFWGATDSQEIHPHLQSYFLVFAWHVFHSHTFRDFMNGITKQPNVQEVIKKYEIGLTKTLDAAGFKRGAMVENRLKGSVGTDGKVNRDPTYGNITAHPQLSMNMGSPLFKAKAFRQCSSNYEGIRSLLLYLKQRAPEIYHAAVSNADIARHLDDDQVGFSVIMPSHNRAWCISSAVKSVLAQTHPNFELIIVDDGSKDDSVDLLNEAFADEIANGKLRVIGLAENVGVSSARNIGIAHARKEWIAYADSDNNLRPEFLSVAASAIVANPKADCVFGRILNKDSGVVIGSPYNRASILTV